MRRFSSVLLALVFLVVSAFTVADQPVPPETGEDGAKSSLDVQVFYTNPESGTSEPLGNAEIEWRHCETTSGDLKCSAHSHFKILSASSGGSTLDCETGDSNDDKYAIGAVRLRAEDNEVVDNDDGDSNVALHAKPDGTTNSDPDNSGWWEEDECPVSVDYNIDATTDGVADAFVEFEASRKDADVGLNVNPGAVEVNVDADQTEVESACPNNATACYFPAGDSILVWSGDTNATVTAHEYGHHVHDNSLGGSTGSGPYRGGLSEGVAEFIASEWGSDGGGQLAGSTADDDEAIADNTDGAGITRIVAGLLKDVLDNDSDSYDNVDEAVSLLKDNLVNCSVGGTNDLGTDDFVWCLEGSVDAAVYDQGYFPDVTTAPSGVSGNTAAGGNVRDLWLDVLYCDGGDQDGFPGDSDCPK